jgi:phage terminase small subunit
MATKKPAAKQPAKSQSKAKKPGLSPKKQTKQRTKDKDKDKAKAPPPAPEGELLPEPTPADFAAIGLGEGFTLKEKKFIYHYTMPGPDFMNQSRAALKAGYNKKSAAWLGYQVRRKPDIDAAIKNILNSRLSVDIEEQYQAAVKMLGSRAFFNLADYTKPRTFTIKVGKGEYKDIEVEGFKDLAELTPEQLKAVDGIDYRGVNGTRVLVMADRMKTLTDIINIRNKVNGVADNNDFDIEATADIIKGQLSLKVSARKTKEELSQSADYKKTPKEKTVEEL